MASARHFDTGTTISPGIFDVDLSFDFLSSSAVQVAGINWNLDGALVSCESTSSSDESSDNKFVEGSG